MSLHDYYEPFENAQVYDTELPRVAALDFVGLEPAKLKVDLISTVILFVMLAAIITGLSLFSVPYYDTFGWILWVVWSVLFALMLTLTYLGFKKKKYALRSHDIIYRRGLIWRSDIVIPFNRVQHCEVNEGPIERLYGLAQLNVYTAGGSSSDLSIVGLRSETAHRLKAFIVKKTYDEEE